MLHVLFVENNSFLVANWQKALQSDFPDNIRMDSADNGVQALEKIKAGQSYDLIFMHTKLPVPKLCTLGKAIKVAGYTRPLIAHTSLVFQELAQTMVKDCFDGFLIKRKEATNLISFLTEYSKQRARVA